MAELLVLVLFVLLLLIGFQAKEARQAKEDQKRLVQIAAAAGVAANNIPDEFEKLVEAVRLQSERSAGGVVPVDAAVEVEKRQLGQRLLDGMGPNSVGLNSAAAAKEFVNAAVNEFAKHRGEFGTASMWLKSASTAQEAMSGKGGDLPPCAVTSEGRPAYVLTAHLYSQDISFDDRDLESLHKVTGALSAFAQLTRSTKLSTARFRQESAAIRDWSVSKGCRFFVWIQDETALIEKRTYKERLRTVGEIFYYYEPTSSVEGRRE